MTVDKEQKLLAAAELRRLAEERWREALPHAVPRSGDETHRLVHELEVHQIELELQNAELRQARDETETLLEKYTDLYDFAPVGYATLDCAGTFLAVNLNGAALFGCERSRLIGHRFGQFVAETARPDFAEFLQRAFASAEKVSCELPLAVTVPRSVQIEALLAASGQECRVAILDVTERRACEERSAFLASFPQLNPNPVLEVDTDCRVTYHNPATERVLRSAGLDATATTLFVPDDLHAIFAGWDKRREVILTREIAIDGLVFEEVVFLSPLFKDARIYAADITERKLAEACVQQVIAELQSANLELEAFNYTVSHDLRQPLTSIHGFCQVLLEHYGDRLDDFCKELVRGIYSSAQNMNRLIGALLEFSSATRGTLRRSSIDLSRFAHEIASELQRQHPELHGAFRIGDGITAQGDAALLRVVMNNLLGNAWKYSGERGEALIEFAALELDGRPVYFVRDNGPGFDMAYADKLFSPFQRLPGTKAEGHGIGLATVDRIVRRHGGRIWAEAAPGKGATFFFTLSEYATEPDDTA